MIRFSSLFLFLLILRKSYGFSSQKMLRVMTFNTWESGENVENGLNKIAKHIEKVNPDVVGLQEIESEKIITKLIKILGGNWTERHRNIVSAKNPDDVILSRHPIVPNSFFQTHTAIGCRILAGNLNFTFISVHLNYLNSGRYTACNELVTDPAQLEAGELNLGSKLPGRYQNVRNLIGKKEFQEATKNADSYPVVVVGDFNSPSHLDWIEAMKSYHCGWSFQWPATKMLTKQGFRDSFRELHPDPTRNLGITWSTTHKFISDSGNTIPEPQDRLDFIFYKGRPLRPVTSFVYKGTEGILPQPFHKWNDWPSDHAAVITDFHIMTS